MIMCDHRRTFSDAVLYIESTSSGVHTRLYDELNGAVDGSYVGYRVSKT